MKTTYFTLALLAAMAINAKAQTEETATLEQLACSTKTQDYLFAAEGDVLVTVSTGIPYVEIGEIAYGITDKFTVGIIAGTTPVVAGYGLRLRGVVAEPSQNTRILAKAPIFYYPKTVELGGEPWFLTWPTLNFEYQRDCGRRMWAGIGAVGAACALSLKSKIFGGAEDMEMGEGFEGGLWNTVQVGATQPITENVVAHAEIGLVMKGLKVASSDDWVGGPPVIFTLALTYGF